jgi:hypothetical protein
MIYEFAVGDISASLLDLCNDLFGGSSFVDPTFNPRSMAKSKFWCPELKIYMYQACEVESCKFNSMGNEWTGNCILRYMSKHRVQSLSYNELTFLMDKPTADLRSDLLVAIRKIRNGALKNHIIKNQEIGLFERIDSEEVCTVCERAVTDPILKRGFCYCSEECISKRPPTVLNLEHEFCVPFERLIEICSNRFHHNTSYIATALGISKSALFEACANCGVSLPDN